MNVRLLMIMFLLAATASQCQIVEAFEKSKGILCRQQPALCGEADVHSRRLECLRNPKTCENSLYPEIHQTNVPIRTKTAIKNRPLNCRQHPALCKEDRHTNVNSMTKDSACFRNPMACNKGLGPEIHDNNLPIHITTAKPRRRSCRIDPAACIDRDSFPNGYVPKSERRKMLDLISS